MTRIEGGRVTVPEVETDVPSWTPNHPETPVLPPHVPYVGPELREWCDKVAKALDRLLDA